MRKIISNRSAPLAGLLALCLGAVPAFGQRPPGGSGTGSSSSSTGSGSGGTTTGKAKSQLEEWLERALVNNPDIKVAEARLSTAAAELERARSMVMQQVLSLHH